jgi:hypothetical protein
MRPSFALAAGILAFLAASPSAAQSPTSYPYCALDSSTGATSCYYTSRAQCGARCISNPSFEPDAMASAPGARYRAPRR